MNHFSFEYPWMLLLIVMFIVCSIVCKAKGRSLYFPHLKTFLLKSKKRAYLPVLLKWMGIILAIVALASPITSREYTFPSKDGKDIVLVLDSSASMAEKRFDEENLSKSKFTVTKELSSRFVKGRTFDRVGLITFADVAFVSSPLTFETAFLSKIIELQEFGRVGQKRAINDALVQTYSMLERSTSKSKVVILLTDGMDNISQISEAELIPMISKRSVKLYTIGIGLRDDGALKSLAEAGKGRYFFAENAKSLEEIYHQIDILEVSKAEQITMVKKTYLFVYPLLFSILFLLFFIYYRTVHSSGRSLS